MSGPGIRYPAERWFLGRGLPSVLTPRARVRGLVARTAPALAAYATVGVCTLVVFLLTGQRVVDVDGDPTTVERIVLTVVAAALPAATGVGWLVSRLKTPRPQLITAIAAIVVAAVVDVLADGFGALALTFAVVPILLALTALGIGSVLGWAVRLTLSHFSAAGALVTRALPVLLLTILVFFNSQVWLMAGTISQGRLWLALGFLVFIAGVFAVSGILDRIRPVMDANCPADDDATDLARTPFAGMPGPVTPVPLSRAERFNVFFVLAASQLVQILVVAAIASVLFFILGLILTSPEVLAVWTQGGSADGTVLGMTLPVPQALIHVTMFLGALTFMYVCARAVGDGEYRAQFLDPLIDDLRVTLIARNRYRASAR